MKKFLYLISLIIMLFCLSSCDLLGGFLGGSLSDDDEKFETELNASTGKWQLLGEEETYFIFDGSKDIMSFSYYEQGVEKYSGTYRVIYRGNGKEVITPLTFVFVRNDKEKEDWIGCYVDNFKTDFTQFTITDEEEDLGLIGGTIYTYTYRISELPYKMGTYVLEGKAFKEELNDCKYANEYYIPSGTYSLSSGESFTVLFTKPSTDYLFQFKNGNTICEGTFTIAVDKKTIYLYIEHDVYSKVTKEDKEFYDTTFSIYYPPDIYLRGNFEIVNDCFVINDLYHHTESPIEIPDSFWSFGTYQKQ